MIPNPDTGEVPPSLRPSCAQLATRLPSSLKSNKQLTKLEESDRNPIKTLQKPYRNLSLVDVKGVDSV